MKKTLLALATASALLVSGSALAAFADAPKGEGAGAGAHIKITGSLTQTDPTWMWQIPANSQTAVTNVALSKTSGVLNGDNLEFAITKTPLSILEGYMKVPARAQPGITPVVTVGGTNASSCSQSVAGADGCAITVVATDADGVSVGSVEASVSFWAATAMYFSSGETDYQSPVVGDVSDEALAVLHLQAGFAEKYPKQAATGSGWKWPMAEHERVLSEAGYRSVSQSRVLKLDSSKLVVPTTAIPATWAATLPITISLK